MKLRSVLIFTASCLALHAEEKRPNIVVIMVDDMGFSDLGCYGGEIDTPNIDALAKGGLRFTQFYNSARCCPTRASLLTGLAPHQSGIGHMTKEEGPDASQLPPAYAGNLNDSCVTLAQVAKSAGYATFMTGKWHLSGNNQADWPMQRGFDRFYGCLAGAIHYFHPFGERIIYNGNSPDHEPKSTTDGPFYTTDAFADHAIRFIDEHAAGPDKAKPFFLYLAFNAPHWPHHAPDKELDKYRGKYDIGWDKLREIRYGKQVASGLIPAAWKMSPRDSDVPAWDSLEDKQRSECSLRMAAYAGAIDRIDQKVGDLVADLKKHKAYENTLILFLSDNGACAELSLLGIGDPVKDRAPNSPLHHPSYGKAWANVSSTPYILYKHHAHEGGSNTPFIAHWPARIREGRDWFREPAQLIDIMPTVVALTGAAYPASLNGHPILRGDGVPLVPAFDGKSLSRKSPLFIEHENNAFVRDGEWKLVAEDVAPPRGLQSGKWQLFHMSEDGTELKDLAAAMPDKVKAMSDQWQQWAWRVGIYPKPPAKAAKKKRLSTGMKILSKNLLILASAGSGKTFQLANRIIGLVALGVAPEKIVALTFTRKAAGEFADSVLTKLAKASSDPKAAAKLREDLDLPETDFAQVLERVVRSLPGFTLGTLDSFFARVVRGFQYELGLTGGKFNLLEGGRADAATDEILAALLGEALDNETGDEFLRAFQRANFGKEEQGVLKGLRDFVDRWQSRYRAALEVVWGPGTLAGVRVEDWEEQKAELVSSVLRGLDAVTFTRGDQRKLLEAALDTLQAHTIGSGSLNQAPALLGRILEAWQIDSGPVELKHYKEFSVGGPAGEALRRLARLAARCEMAAAVDRTKAVRDMIAVYDARRETQLRGRGLLGFDDVKILMGAWAKNEDARIWREQVDYRLGARHEHWLLDEFQDTSRGEWTGLLPLIDEAAAADGEGTMFIVGDRKQAIYGWRGGDVGLFDDVIGRYENLNVAPMAESWRSSPEVLALVNTVFGDNTTMQGLFGAEAAAKWQWDPHVSSQPLADPTLRGEARVEIVEDKWEGRLERLENLLEELGIGDRNLSCGILVRSNTLVAEIATELRAKGFDVIEEGQREPSKDNPVGVAIGHLLKWLANPDDTFAAGILAMSPFAASLRAEFGEHWQRTWEELTAHAAAAGFAEMIAHVVQPHWGAWSDFGKRRAGDIMTALAEFDAQGGASPREAADWIDRLEVSQSPGSAAVQVMTIHKAKGLGFDVVILPDIPSKATPESQRFTVAEGEGWISQTPPQWARSWVPEMREAEARWSAVQRHQDFCMLYVALTRAKRGLYILLDKPSKSQPEDKASLANWLASSIRSTGEAGVRYQSGLPDWIDNLPRETKTREISATPRLATGTPRRERKTPTSAKAKSGAPIARSPGGMQFGTAVHEAFECVAWIDESAPKLPAGEGGETVRKLLGVPSIRAIFERKGRNVTCLREQPIDAVLDGAWLSGVIDRLHLHREGKAITRVEIIDFKSDIVDDLSALSDRYGPQMEAYREVIRGVYPAASVDCMLVSTRLAAVAAI